MLEKKLKFICFYSKLKFDKYFPNLSWTFESFIELLWKKYLVKLFFNYFFCSEIFGVLKMYAKKITSWYCYKNNNILFVLLCCYDFVLLK